ncbi:MAG: DUF2779 domain-containing protein [Candidatus Coproplasma sp.]
MNISKSKYVSFCYCPKRLWLDVNHPELADDVSDYFAKRGVEFGDYVKDLFGDYVEVTQYKKEGGLNYNGMINSTKVHIALGTPNICEAAFSYQGCYCAVDILHKTGNGYEIYEVKSSTEIKDKYLVDIAYQKYVLVNCGLNITGVYIVHVNKDYVRCGEIDKSQLCKIEEVSDRIGELYSQVEGTIKTAKDCAEGQEPAIPFNAKCKECIYHGYCFKDLPRPNVFDLYGIRYSKACEYANQGKVSFADMTDTDELKNKKRKSDPIRKLQYETEAGNLPATIDKVGIKAFLEGITFPLYFLDFEFYNPIIPLYDGDKPSTQIAFQYSLHVLSSPTAEVEHREFLAQADGDPRRPLAERLVADIGGEGTVLAFHMSTECGVIEKLAGLYPDLAKRLIDINGRMQDLLDVFRSGYYYDRAMVEGFSIKTILPAIYPDDPELNYHNLEGVHNGNEAMEIFPLLKSMTGEEADKARGELLKYCCLDTFAMVKIWQKLVEVSK